MSLDFVAPQPLTSLHDCTAFASGEPILDDWLKRRAMANQVSGASRTFVVVNSLERVFGYYALAAGAVSHRFATGNVRRNMPDPIPVMVLGRLAVDRQVQGIKMGASLLQDAVNRTIHIAQNTGVRALLVHAINERATTFYQYHGFQASPLDPSLLMLGLGHIPRD